MNMKERNRIRKAQDELLRSRVFRQWVKKHSWEAPIFGEGSPSAKDLELYIFPRWVDRIEYFLRHEK